MAGDRQTPEERFTRLFDAHYAAVRAYAWRRGPDSADDVVAETFTIAWRRLGSVPAEPLPWLIGVARNVRRNLERGERRRRAREPDCVDAVVAPSFAGALEAAAVLHTALEGLPAGDREILLLVAWEGLDRAGLAAALGCSAATAGVRLFRARRRLAAALALAEGQEPRLAAVQGSPRPCPPAGDPEGSVLDEC